jgi:hypothetical protein
VKISSPFKYVLHVAQWDANGNDKEWNVPLMAYVTLLMYAAICCYFSSGPEVLPLDRRILLRSFSKNAVCRIFDVEKVSGQEYILGTTNSRLLTPLTAAHLHH